MFFLSVILPAFIAFKRGHNGYAIVSIVLATYAIGFGVVFWAESFLPWIIIYAIGWSGSILYCILVKGSEGDKFEELNEKYETADEEIEEGLEISDNDYILVKSYTGSWQQSNLMDDLELLNENNIPYKSNSGLLATIMVKVCDYDKAALLLRVS